MGRRYGKGRRGKKRSTKVYGQSMAGKALSLALKVAKGLALIRGMVNCEKQYVDTNQTGQVVSNAGQITNLSAIAEGDDVSQRKGNSILARSLYLQADVVGNAVNTTNMLRCIIFQDQENTGTDPTVADILQFTGSALAVESPLNIDHIARYKILLDKKFVFTTTGHMRTNFKKYLNLHTHIKYTGTASTDIYRGQIYILWISDVATNDPSVTWNARLGYYDN